MPIDSKKTSTGPARSPIPASARTLAGAVVFAVSLNLGVAVAGAGPEGGGPQPDIRSFQAPRRRGPTRQANCPIPPGVESVPGFGDLSLFTRTLFYMRDRHPREITPPMTPGLLLAALDAVAAQDRSVQVEREPDSPPRWVTVTAAGHPCTLSLEQVNAPWMLRAGLQQALRFTEGYLTSTPSPESEQRLTRIELAATNGMLSAFDGRSQLLDPETYRAVRRGPPNAQRAEPADARSVPAPTGPAQPVVTLRIRRFDAGVAGEVQQALTASQNAPATGFILDLRDNPGGLFDEALKVADAFIKEGSLGAMVGKRERKDLVAHADGHEPAGAVVVLVNRRTVGAAELVAADIKRLGRGVVLGELTAGAASIDVFFDLPKVWRHGPSPNRDVVQDVIDGVKPTPPKDEPVGDPFGLRLMTGRLLASGGAEIDRIGVRPDIELAASSSDDSGAGKDCTLRFALTLLAQARDPQRPALLGAAKAIPIPAACGRAAPP